MGPRGEEARFRDAVRWVSDLATGERAKCAGVDPSVVGQGEDEEVRGVGSGQNWNARREVFEGSVWKGKGAGGIRQDSRVVRVGEDAADWEWEGGGHGRNSGSEPETVAGDEGFGIVLERDVSEVKA